ncbi:hypothetical protein ACIQV2_11945 [Streptomyces globosus]|uniref:hypothetical protein n=1 Tax=Streptomyces globosus TaxID=68209 RepID=UPI00382CA463
MNRIIRALALTTGTAALCTLAAVPAQAATISGGSCGAGYRLQDAYPLGTDRGADGSGVISLYYSSSTGKNCAILRRDANFNITDGMGVTLTASNGASDTDGQRAYRDYAGPVYVAARGMCVKVSGHVTGAWKGSFAAGTFTGGSGGWVHCG